MKKFLRRILVFLSPLLFIVFLLLGSFFVLDPFKIVHDYNEYYHSSVAYNEDYIVTERFIKSDCSYDSYIFGSSRAGCGFQKEDWQSFLDAKCKAYSFTASNESIFGIHGKIKLLAEQHCKLENALIVIDGDLTLSQNKNSSGHLFVKHPMVSRESRWSFISVFLKNYIFTGFFVRYLDYKTFKKRRPYMKGFLSFYKNDETHVYKPFHVEQKEKRIKRKNHYEQSVFYQRSKEQIFYKEKITKQGLKYLQEIKEILDKLGTNYQIIISPLYDQKKIAVEDINTLKNLFGADRLWNLSGQNNLTDDKFNYYESSHYRPKVGISILESIYNKK